MSPTATKLRRLLAEECRAASEVDPSACALRLLDKDSWQDFGGEAALYTETSFCLLPPGDIPSRKAVIDAMLAGCIPVLFDHRQISFYAMHILGGWQQQKTLAELLHFMRNMFVLFDSRHLPAGGIIQNLMAYSPARVQEMRSALRAVGWHLQYAIPPTPHALQQQQLGETASLSPGGLGNILSSWQPPYPDALDVILSSLGI